MTPRFWVPALVLSTVAGAQTISLSRVIPESARIGDEAEIQADAQYSGLPAGATAVRATFTLTNSGTPSITRVDNPQSGVQFRPARITVNGALRVEVELEYVQPVPNTTTLETRTVRASSDIPVDSRVPAAQLSATAQSLNTWAARTISTQGLDLAAADTVRVTFQHASTNKQLLVYRGDPLDLAEVARGGVPANFTEPRIAGSTILFGLATAVSTPADQNDAEEARYLGDYNVFIVVSQTRNLPAGIVRRGATVVLRNAYQVTGPVDRDAVDITAIRFTVDTGDPARAVSGVWRAGVPNVLNAPPSARLRLEFEGGMVLTRYWRTRISPSLQTARDNLIELPVDAFNTNGARIPLEDQSFPGAHTPLRAVFTLPAEAQPVEVSLSLLPPSSSTPKGRSNTIQVIWQPPQDVTIENIEVVQVMQDPRNTVPLIAGKRTVARVFVVARGETPLPQPGVECTLKGFRDGVELAGAPTVISPVYPATAPGGQLQRDNTDHSINFELPASWIDAGRLELRAEVKLTAGQIDPRPENNTFELPPVTFQATAFGAQLHSLWFKVCLQQDGSRATCPPGTSWSASSERAGGWIQKLFPVPEGTVRYLPLTRRTKLWREQMAPGNWNFFEYLQRMRAHARSLSPALDSSQLTAIFPTGSVIPLSAADSRPAQGSALINTPVNWIVDQDGLDANGLAQAHEVAHSAGLRHPDTSDNGSAAAPEGYWQQGPDRRSSAVQEVGFDVEARRAVPASNFDLMAYRSPRWISPFHYRRLIASTTHGDLSAVLTPEAGRSEGPSESIVVSGWVNLDSNNGFLEPAFRVISPQPVKNRWKNDGEYCIRLFNGTQRLSDNCFDLPAGDSDEGTSRRRGFSFAMPLPAGSNRVSFARGTVELGLLADSGINPVLTLQSPQTGARWQGRQRIGWAATVAGDRPLTHAVYFSPDGGQTWQILDVEPGANGLDLHSADLPVSDNALIRVATSSGWNSTVRTSGAISILPSPRGELSAPRIDFGAAAPGQAVGRAVTLYNTGNAPLRISSVRLEGAAFALQGTAPASLDSGASFDVLLRFTPAGGGGVEGVLILATNDGDNPEIRLPLSGVGTGVATQAPVIAVSPARLDFGPVDPGQSRDLTIEIANRGTAPLTVSAITSSSPRFVPAAFTAPLTLAPATTRQLAVRFSPDSAGESSATLTIASDDPSRPLVTVSVVGRGGQDAASAPRIEVAPTAVGFGSVTVGQSNDQQVTIRNSGASALSVTALTTANPVFSVVSPRAPFTVSAGATSVITVRFGPVSAGPADTALTIGSNDPRQPSVTVALSGSGAGVTAQGRLAVTPPAIDFGSAPVGEPRTSTVTLRNTGAGILTVTSLNVSGAAFTIGGATAPLVLAPNGSQAFTVRMLALESGPQRGTLTIASDDPASAVTTVSLTVTATGTVSRELTVEDGVFERYHRQTVTTQYYVNRLTPARYPATLKTIRIYIGQETISPGDQITFLWANNLGGSPELAPLSLRSAGVRVLKEEDWLEFQVPGGLTIQQGDFVVGFASTNSGSRTVALDDSGYRERSYISFDGGTFRLGSTETLIGRSNFGIRAVLE